MAGIGFELRRIFGKKTLASSTLGVIYASLTTVGPSLVFLLLLAVLRILMVFYGLGEKESLFFTFSFTYLFLLAIVTSSLQNGVMSRYVSDKIFVGNDADICASMFGVLTFNCLFSAAQVSVLCLLMWIHDRIPLTFLAAYYLLGILGSTAYTMMVYISALKEYKKVTLSYLTGVVLVFPVLFVLVELCHVHLVLAMYWALVVGFAVICTLLVVCCVRAFGKPSNHYFDFLRYYRKHWRLVVSNTAWILGFYISNVIYWFGSEMQTTVSIFSTAPNYDLAMFLAILVNLSGMVVFEVKTETRVFDRYVSYLSAVGDGVYENIEKERISLQSEINLQLFFSYEVQLIITVVLICLINIFYPYIGVNTDVLNMFMLLGMGLYSAFCMYFTVIFLYYFDDNTAALMGPCVFLAIVVIGSLICCFVGEPFYPLPLLVGGIVGWIVSFVLLRRRLRDLNSFILCH